MADPWGIVVVPAEGDPGGLLAEGLCGARPPVVSRAQAGPICAHCGAPARWSSAPTDQSESCWVCSVDWRHAWPPFIGRRSDAIAYTAWTEWSVGGQFRGDGQHESALVLRWNGALVPEGWDRARRVWAFSVGHLTADDWPSMPTVEDVQRLAGDLLDLGDTSRVVLLDLVDGRLVERQP